MTLAFRSAFMGLGAMVLLLVTARAAMTAGTTQAATAGSVTVTVRYTGQGDVDDSHRIWIWLFDTPDIGPGSMPIREASIAKNGGSTMIDGLGGGTVWIAVAYDQRGGSTGNAPPASGSPVGMHASADGRPVPVTPGDGARVDVRFDDSLRMP